MFKWIQLKTKRMQCDRKEFFLNHIGAIVKLAKGPKYVESKTKQDIVDAALQVQIYWYEKEIAKIYNRLHTIPKDLLQSCLDGLSTIKPAPMTATFPPHSKNAH